MSNTIQIKRSSTAASVPTAGQLAVGELAVNLTDKKLFTKDASNAVVELGGAGVALTGDQTIAGVKTFSSSPVVPTATTSGQAVNKGQLDAVTSVGTLRAWANFDGQTGSGNTIRAGGNVSSVTRNNTGEFTINFTTAMPDANYSTVGTAIENTTANTRCVMPFSYSTSSVQIRFRNGSDNVFNPLIANIAVFR
jgi:hypothetical protein